MPRCNGCRLGKTKINLIRIHPHKELLLVIISDKEPGFALLYLEAHQAWLPDHCWSYRAFEDATFTHRWRPRSPSVVYHPSWIRMVGGIRYNLKFRSCVIDAFARIVGLQFEPTHTDAESLLVSTFQNVQLGAYRSFIAVNDVKNVYVLYSRPYGRRTMCRSLAGFLLRRGRPHCLN